MSNLTAALKGLGYSNDSIRRIEKVAETEKAAEVALLRAVADRHAGMVDLMTPMQCAAQSERHAAALRQVDGAIYHASGCTYRLPANQKVGMYDVDKAIRNAPLESRLSIKGQLHALGLIAA
jgi:hypothetical protein